jgi:hypothetical protein
MSAPKVLLRSEQSGGQVAIVESTMPPGAKGPPLHTLANRSSAPARFLIVFTPAGFERMFARRAAEQAGLEPPEWALQPIPDVVRVGPRIGEQ